MLLDGYNGWVPPDYNDDISPMDVLSMMALILLCCMTLSCLISSVNLASTSGIIVIDGHPGNNNGNNDEDLLPGRYRHGLRLLNTVEVLSLPEIEYNSVVHNHYINGNGRGGDGHGDNDGVGNNNSSSSINDEAKPIITSDGTMICVEESMGVSGEEESIEAISLCDMNMSSGNISLVSSDNDSSTTGAASATRRLSSPGGGLSPLPTNTANNNSEELYHDGACTICLEDYNDGDKLRILPCQHAFHSECILPWLTERAPTCPLCKALLEVEREGDEAHRQMLQQRRQAAEEGGEGNGDEGEGLSTILSGDVEEGDTDEQNVHRGSNEVSSWRSWYNNLRGRNSAQRQEEEDHDDQQQSDGQQQEIELQSRQSRTQQADATEQLDRRSTLVRALTPTWRLLFQRSNDQDERQDMREPLLEQRSNREGERGDVSRTEIV